MTVLGELHTQLTGKNNPNCTPGSTSSSKMTCTIKLKSREGNPEGGLLCQDCHSTTSLHGNGNITGTLLANVQIFGALLAAIVGLLLIEYFIRRRSTWK